MKKLSVNIWPVAYVAIPKDMIRELLVCSITKRPDITPAVLV